MGSVFCMMYRLSEDSYVYTVRSYILSRTSNFVSISVFQIFSWQHGRSQKFSKSGPQT